ncbi:MAG: hypothetical protein M1399_09680 [Actinobacteria bacterium]|nr:hypothetical protein [Actinomycetota bacterium]MCL5447387.1 hypothetical protein [Actinomycetota bacterium]
MHQFEHQDGSFTGEARDLASMAVAYAKQETLDPLKGALRYILFGVAGALLISIGSISAMVGVLRVLQGETGSTFRGSLSWVPYIIVSLLAIAMAGLAAWRIPKMEARKREEAAGR